MDSKILSSYCALGTVFSYTDKAVKKLVRRNRQQSNRQMWSIRKTSLACDITKNVSHLSVSSFPFSI